MVRQSTLLITAVLVLSAACGSASNRPSVAVWDEAWCGAAAQLVEPLRASGGLRGAAVEQALADLVVASNDSDPLLAELEELSRASAEPTGRESDNRWASALDELDERVAERCGFSISLLIGDASTDAESETVADASDEPGDGSMVALPDLQLADPLDVASVRHLLSALGHRVADNVVTLGVDEVTRVQIADVAEGDGIELCRDLLDAFEAQPGLGAIEITVIGRRGQIVARSSVGDCLAVLDLADVDGL